MESYKTLEEVTKLFQNNRSFGEQNNYFISFVTTKNARGGFLAGMETQMKNRCDAYVVNQSEKGLGLLPLHRTGSLLTANDVDKLEADVNDFRFIPKESIQKIRVKNFSLISPSIKQVVIKLTDGTRYDWLVYKKQKKVEYHLEGFTNFMENCKK